MFTPDQIGNYPQLRLERFFSEETLLLYTHKLGSRNTQTAEDHHGKLISFCCSVTKLPIFTIEKIPFTVQYNTHFLILGF